jgi:hypothetical protein
VSGSLYDYYRCPEGYLKFAPRGPLSERSGYFRFGRNVLCFGRYSGLDLPSSRASALHDAATDTITEDETTYLPFDLNEVLDNFRWERYVGNGDNRYSRYLQSPLKKLYYMVRPVLPFGVRGYIKRLHLRGREDQEFPRWPVDCSVDTLAEQLLLFSIRASGRAVPFVWFWPEGASSCAIMTHDVETERGMRFCPDLMDIDDSFGIKASFQIVPEERYSASQEFLASIRERGFEVVVHDLNHDGDLYRDREQFLRRAARINFYQKLYGAEGFRAAVLYRNQLWFDAFTCSYDMSVPNVARLDPQGGGCCTVMPYFIGDILELPVTTTQDYMLYYILNDYSIGLWKRQIDLIMQRSGLMSFIVHPDYIMKDRERAVYEQLLAYLDELRQKSEVWITTPGEVNRWWRQRVEMRLVENGGSWRIEGAGNERARVAYASEQDGHVVYSFDPPADDERGCHNVTAATISS